MHDNDETTSKQTKTRLIKIATLSKTGLHKITPKNDSRNTDGHKSKEIKTESLQQLRGRIT